MYGSLFIYLLEIKNYLLTDTFVTEIHYINFQDRVAVNSINQYYIFMHTKIL